MNRYAVSIKTVNPKGKIVHDFFETDNMINATRILLTFKPKRGYLLIQANVDVFNPLV